MMAALEFPAGARAFWLVLAACALAGYLAYRGVSGISAGKKRLLAVLRCLALLVPALCLLEPRLVMEEKVVRPAVVALMADLSESTSVKAGDTLDQAWRDRLERRFGGDWESMSVLDQQKMIAADLEKNLGEGCRVVVSGYGSSSRPLLDAASWDASDRRTLLADAIRRVAAERRDEALEAIIVMGDGRIEDLEAATATARGLEADRPTLSILALAVGNPDAKPDARVESLSAPDVAVKSPDPCQIRAQIATARIPQGTPLTLTLKADGQVVEQRQVTADATGHQSLEFQAPLGEAGERSWTLDIAPLERETNLENNIREARTLVKDARLRILYIEDTPRWDYHKIVQFMERRPLLFDSSVLLLQASARIQQRGSKPIRELPKTFEDLWAAADVVLLGNVGIKAFEGSTFVENLERFVSKGGGLVFLAGSHNNPLSYRGTRLEALLPVILAPGPGVEAGVELFHAVPTRRGALHAITRLDDTLAASLDRWKRVPGLRWHHPIAGLKPSAEPLLEHESQTLPLEASRKVPLVATMGFGRGQCVWVGIDEIHRWAWLDEREEPVEKFLSGLVSYTASRKISGSSGPCTLEISTDTLSLGDSVDVALRHDKPESVSGSTFELKWSVDGSEPRTLTLKREDGDSGMFRATFTPDRRGLFRLWTEDTLPRNLRVGSFSRELEEPSLSLENLGALARIDNVFKFDEDEALGRRVMARQIVETRRETRGFLVEPDIWWILSFLCLVLGAEWWIRKRSQLP